MTRNCFRRVLAGLVRRRAGRDQEKLDDMRTDARQTLASLRRAEMEELCVVLGRRGRLSVQRERGFARLVLVV